MTKILTHIAIAMIASLSAMAFADGVTLTAGDTRDANAGGSQFFYQTAAGYQAVTPRLQYYDRKLTASAGNSSSSHVLLQIAYEHGLSQMFSVGAKVGYVSGSNTNSGIDTSISGLTNIDLYGRGTLAMGPGDFKFGADLSLSPGNVEVNANGNQNAYTGGHRITPYVGYQAHAGPGTVGGKLSTQIDLGDRTIDDNGTTTKNSGTDATDLTAFYELPTSGSLLGGELMYQSISSSKSNGQANSNYSPWVGVGIYEVVYAGPGELLPTLRYLWTSDTGENGNSISSLHSWSISAAYRMTF